MLYAIVILLSMTIIAVVNILVNASFFNFEIWYIIVAVIVNTVAVIAVDGLFATVIRRCLPAKWFHHDKKIFQVSKKECRFYEKIGIKKWKDKVLELGMFTSFRKNKLAEPNSVEYVERFLLESNYGYVIHLVCVFMGFLIVFFYPLQYFLCFGVPIAFVNAVLNLLPAFILRYNTPKLKTLYKFNLKKQQKENTLV